MFNALPDYGEFAEDGEFADFEEFAEDGEWVGRWSGTTICLPIHHPLKLLLLPDPTHRCRGRTRLLQTALPQCRPRVLRILPLSPQPPAP